jgi:hypothetical protein
MEQRLAPPARRVLPGRPPPSEGKSAGLAGLGPNTMCPATFQPPAPCLLRDSRSSDGHRGKGERQCFLRRCILDRARKADSSIVDDYVDTAFAFTDERNRRLDRTLLRYIERNRCEFRFGCRGLGEVCLQACPVDPMPQALQMIGVCVDTYGKWLPSADRAAVDSLDDPGWGRPPRIDAPRLVAADGSSAGEHAETLAQVTEVEDGPARNRTANPLIKSSLADEATTGHGGLPPEIPEDCGP